MVGLIERPEHITTQWFKDEGDAIILLGDIVDASDPLRGLGGSAHLQRIHGLKAGTPPRCDLEREKVRRPGENVQINRGRSSWHKWPRFIFAPSMDRRFAP